MVDFRFVSFFLIIFSAQIFSEEPQLFIEEPQLSIEEPQLSIEELSELKVLLESQGYANKESAEDLKKIVKAYSESYFKELNEAKADLKILYQQLKTKNNTDLNTKVLLLSQKIDFLNSQLESIKKNLPQQTENMIFSKFTKWIIGGGIGLIAYFAGVFFYLRKKIDAIVHKAKDEYSEIIDKSLVDLENRAKVYTNSETRLHQGRAIDSLARALWSVISFYNERGENQSLCEHLFPIMVEATDISVASIEKIISDGEDKTAPLIILDVLSNACYFLGIQSFDSSQHVKASRIYKLCKGRMGDIDERSRRYDEIQDSLLSVAYKLKLESHKYLEEKLTTLYQIANNDLKNHMKRFYLEISFPK